MNPNDLKVGELYSGGRFDKLMVYLGQSEKIDCRYVFWIFSMHEIADYLDQAVEKFVRPL